MEEERIKKLVKALDNPELNLKEDSQEVNQEVFNEEFARLGKLAKGDINEFYYVSGKYGTGGRGQTVNTIANNYDSTVDVAAPKPEPNSLKPAEALDVSVKRTLRSGTPVNNISFYDEVNWNLMRLGYPAKNAVDIKNSILKLLGDASPKAPLT